MAEVERIADQLVRAFEGDTWTGASLKEIVAGIPAAAAAAHPVPGAHSAWEILLHLTTWLRIARRRLAGEACDPTDEENFPAVTDVSPAAWQRTWSEVERVYRDLATAIRATRDADLDAPVPGRSYDRYHLLHGVVQHSLYHAGQMVLIGRAAR